MDENSPLPVHTDDGSEAIVEITPAQLVSALHRFPASWAHRDDRVHMTEAGFEPADFPLNSATCSRSEPDAGD